MRPAGIVILAALGAHAAASPPAYWWPGQTFARLAEPGPERTFIGLHRSASGDLNGDGHDDAAFAVVMGHTDESLRLVLFLSGQGGHVRHDLGSAGTIADLAVADVDADGRDDLLVLSEDAELRVFVQQPDGTLAASVTTAFGGHNANWSETKMLTGDVDADGLTEVVVVGVRPGTGENVAMLGDFVGGVPTAVRFDTGPEYHYDHSDVGLADLNADGLLDLLSLGSGGFRVSLFDGVGFGPVQLHKTAGRTFLADLDGDGAKDLCIAGAGVLTIRWSGTLPPQETQVPFPADWRGGEVFTGDFDADGREDVLAEVGQETGGRAVTAIYPGPYRVDGWFSPAQLNGARVADMNQDGRDDVMTFADGLVSLALSAEPDPVLPGFRVTEIPGIGGAARAADLTGNGLGDLVIGRSVVLQSAPGVFADPIEFPEHLSGDYAVLGDWNADGRTDIGWRSQTDSVPVYLNTGGPPVPESSILYDFDPGVGAVQSATSVRLVPGHDHLVVSTPNALHRFRVHGGKLVLDQSIETPQTPRALSAMDFDDDGRTDVVGVYAEQGTVVGFRNLGDAALGQPAVLIVAPGRWWGLLAGGDVDHDGYDDLVIGRTNAASVASVAVCWGAPGGYSEPQLLEVPGPLRRVHAADLDGDGKVEIVCSSSHAHERAGSVFIIQATGSRELAIVATVRGQEIEATDVGDVDGDGRDDIVIGLERSHAAARILYNAPPAPCVADLTADGALNFFDLARAVALFNSGDDAMDLAEPFGELNFFDLAAYLNLFNAGCP